MLDVEKMSDVDEREKVEEVEEKEIEESLAIPLADEDLAPEIYELLQNASHRRQLKKGANEVTKAVNRSVAEIVVMAADTEPLHIVLHLPLACEEKNIAYVFVPSKVALGRAVGVSRSVIAATITSNDESDLKSTIRNIQERIEKIMI